MLAAILREIRVTVGLIRFVLTEIKVKPKEEDTIPPEYEEHVNAYLYEILLQDENEDLYEYWTNQVGS